MTTPQRIGFVGIGNMGGPMAARLAAAGFSLAIADADGERAARFAAEHGAAIPANLRTLGESVEVVITMLPDGKTVREVVEGLAAGLAPGTVIIDMSSSAPLGTKALGESLAKRGIGLIDAPVSGGVRRAVDGSLAIMVGGDTRWIERCRPLLEAMGRQIFLTGPLGSGHAMKALNNYVSAAGLVAASEAVLIGARFGLDPQAMTDILNASTGRNNSTENKLKPFILAGRFNSGFGLGLMTKDLATAVELAEAEAVPVPLGTACLALWRAAVEQLGGSADHTEIFRFLEAIDRRTSKT